MALKSATERSSLSPSSFLRNQKGETLVMVIVAAAIGVLVALGVVSAITDLQNSVNNIQFRSDAGTLNEEMRALLSSKQACLNSLGGLKAELGASHDVTKLMDGTPPAPGIEKYMVGKTYGNGNSTTILNSMTLAKFEDGVAGSASAVMTLTNSLMVKKKSTGPQLVPRDIKISVEYDLTTKLITGCVALSSMSDGIWQRSTANQKNIFFNGVPTPGNGGLVGIGIESPAATFQLNGPNANASTDLPLFRITDTTYAAGTYFAVDNGATQDAYRLISSNINPAAVSQKLELQAGANSAQLVLNPSGNVGIGTATPSSLLQVNGGIRAAIGAPGSADTSNVGFSFAQDGDTGMFRVNTANPAFGSDLALFIDSTERVRIANNGNVGIGTPNPGFLLDIRAPDNSTVHVAGINSGVRGGLSVDTPVAGSFYAGSYSVAPFVLGVNNSERMRIETNGNVGIGKSPQTVLDVNGGIRAGGASATGDCGPEGAMGYDYVAHAPLYCNDAGKWTKVGSGGTIRSSVVTAGFNSIFGGIFTCPKGVPTACYGAYPNGTLCAAASISDNSCTIPPGCSGLGALGPGWTAFVACAWTE